MRDVRCLIIDQGWGDAKIIKNWHKEAIRKVEEAVAAAQHEPGPDPYKEDWCALSSRQFFEGGQS